MDPSINKIIRKFALKNAIDHGRADEKAVMGKAFHALNNTVPMPELKTIIKEEVDAVNKLGKDQLEMEFAPFREEFDRQAKDKLDKNAPKLSIEGAEQGKVFTRYPPEPGGYIHIGNAKQCILSEAIAKLYGGSIYLYWDDTNPEKCKQEFVDQMKLDLAWLGVSFGKEYFASDYIETVYDCGRKLMRQGDAYVCLCAPTEVKKNRMEKIECAHRHQDKEQNLALFEDMLSGKFDEGQVVVRFKGDMSSDNTTFRDPSLFRIKKTPHYRKGTKYMVWPNYFINTPVIDHLNGITDVVRGKEYEIFNDLYNAILSALGYPQPRLHVEARLRIKGSPTSKRYIRKFISEGNVKSWDDPRLMTLAALRRRGVQPDAIRELIMGFGLSTVDSVVNIDMLLAYNRKIIDRTAKHFYFVRDPVKVAVQKFAPRNSRQKLHPVKDYGFREYSLEDGIFYIDNADASSLQVGETVRLKDLVAIKIISMDGSRIFAEELSENEGRAIQWVAEGRYSKCTVLIPGDLVDSEGNYILDSLQTVKGYVEGASAQLKEHEISQFERFGYCILDDRAKNQFIFVSK